jgi:MFS family permease
VFLGEVAEPGMRGLLTSIPFVSYSFGIFIIYTLGATLPWQTVAWLAAILPLLSFLSFTVMPESPVWLVRNDRIHEAGEALNWLRGKHDGGVKVRMCVSTHLAVYFDVSLSKATPRQMQAAM